MEGSPHREELLPVEPVLRAIAECPALGIGSLFLTGGEPLLYRDLDKVLDAAAGASDLRTTVCTNGTLLTSRQAARFHELGVRLNISIDGPPEFPPIFADLEEDLLAIGVRLRLPAGRFGSSLATKKVRE
jgi:MoaA/NifB/PqqE/SkfB family radical SAM enzyme